jgi:hypothetical protein
MRSNRKASLEENRGGLDASGYLKCPMKEPIMEDSPSGYPMTKRVLNF